jgi:hypothetical protein
MDIERAMDAALFLMATGVAGFSVYDGNAARLIFMVLVAALCGARLLKSQRT